MAMGAWFGALSRRAAAFVAANDTTVVEAVSKCRVQRRCAERAGQDAAAGASEATANSGVPAGSGVSAAWAVASTLLRFGCFLLRGCLGVASRRVPSEDFVEEATSGGVACEWAATTHASSAALISAFRLRRFCFLSSWSGFTSGASIRSA